jgi:hypothetical protein
MIRANAISVPFARPTKGLSIGSGRRQRAALSATWEDFPSATCRINTPHRRLFPGRFPSCPEPSLWWGFWNLWKISLLIVDRAPHQASSRSCPTRYSLCARGL